MERLKALFILEIDQNKSASILASVGRICDRFEEIIMLMR
jgi:hypothetical protein